VYKAILCTQDHNYEIPHFFSQQTPSKIVSFGGHVHGRAVKLGEPGGRLAEELKVMEVSAGAQGGKDAIRFHKMVLFRFTFYIESQYDIVSTV
jgi:hypothetical protein